MKKYSFRAASIFPLSYRERKRPGTRTLLNPTPNIVHPVIPSNTGSQLQGSPIRNQPKQKGKDQEDNTEGILFFFLKRKAAWNSPPSLPQPPGISVSELMLLYIKKLSISKTSFTYLEKRRKEIPSQMVSLIYICNNLIVNILGFHF